MSVDLHTPLSVRVSVITRQTDEISSFELTPLTDVALPPFTAGAHIDVATGPHGVRQYSLCNAPSERQRYVLGVKRENPGRGGSRWLHEQVKAGDVLQISAPRNNFALTADATAHLLLAGGIGLTPMLAMARALMSHPKLLLLDEPSMGLSPIMVEKIFEVIRNVSAQGITILLVEQKLTIALKVSSRVCVMGHGRIVFEGTPQALTDDANLMKEWLAV